MQPTFAPWLGYFDLLDRVDLFILLDDVQLSRQSFQTRNRILGTSPEVRWLPVPHDHRTPMAERLISTTPLTDPGATGERTANVLSSFYRGSAWLGSVNDLVRASFAGAATLADANISLIANVASELGIATPTVLSSALGVGGQRSAKVLGLLEAVGWETYACAPGAVGYMAEEGVFARRINTLQLWRVRDVVFEQSLTQRMLGVASIRLLAHDDASPKVLLSGLANGREVFEEVKLAIDLARQSRNVVGLVE